MSIVPRGMGIQNAYKLYRERVLVVNRKYQRKLVWTIAEKQSLISSILKGYPIPLILLAQRTDTPEERFEIIDGMQRLNAIFSFIENGFPIEGKYFDVREFARAKQAAESNAFTVAGDNSPLLSPAECADLLDYQLAITVYPADSEQDITEVFGRINSSGKLLSDQERRQAGVITPFAETIRKLAAELRGDASQESLDLIDMPEISIESKRDRQGYGLCAEDTFWCKQGIIRVNQLRDSEDEQLLADLAASVLLHEPFPYSSELMNEVYDPDTETSKSIEHALAVYTAERLTMEIKSTISVLIETVEAVSNDYNYLRRIVNKGDVRNPIKSTFYAVFMAFFEFMVLEERSPTSPGEIMAALEGLSDKLVKGAHFVTVKDRNSNIAVTKGLLTKFFVKREPPLLKHGPGLALDLENSIRRSTIETPRYEFKQGVLRLDASRTPDPDFHARMVEHLCALANLGKFADGYFFVGVADSEADAKRVEDLDTIKPVKIGAHWCVGIDREVRLLKSTTEKYVGDLLNAIRSSKLTEPLKTQLLSQCDAVTYRGLTIIRIKVPAQGAVSFIGDDAFYRDGCSTKRALGPKLLAINSLY